MGFSRVVWVRTGFAVLVVAVCTMLAFSGEGTLKVEIVDDATGQVLPAMVCITSLSDGTFRTPANERAISPYSTVPEMLAGKWPASDVGPPRLMRGDFHDNSKRLLAYEARDARPFWREPAAYFVTRPFSIALPAGKWRLAVAKGVEYSPVYQDVIISPGRVQEHRIRLSRWVNMPLRGWYSGDPHVHYPRTSSRDDELLLSWAQAEDVHMVSVLSYGDRKNFDFPLPRYGPESRFRRGDYWLESGHEESDDIREQGHFLTLNIRKLVRDTAHYHLYDLVFDRVHAQGGLIGIAHLAFAPDYHRRLHPGLNPTWDTSIDTIRGKVDFFEILQFSHLGLEDFYDFLNLGVKVSASAGSDLPWGATIGEVRTYAYTGREFSPATWYAALKQGRTFVTNGPMLDLSVNGGGPGTELNVRKNAAVRIRARAWAPAAIGAPKRLEIIAQGRSIRSVEARGPEQGQIELQLDVTATRSQWIAARVTAFNGAVAHSSPVYLLVDGTSFAERSQLTELVAKRLQVLDFITARLHDLNFTRRQNYAPGEAELLALRVADARARYQAKLK